MKISDSFELAERHLQNEFSRWPKWLTHWLGYRSKTPSPSPSYIVYIWSFVGAFGGLGILFAVFGHTNYFIRGNVPPIVASFGASAILCHGDIDVPMAQPRALIFGHFFSALVGVIVATIFRFDLGTTSTSDLQWIAACLATAIALVVMQMTRTTHPPAGVTALLPCVDSGIRALKWYFLPVVLLSSSLVLASALLVNNIQRRYPTFWFAPIPTPEMPQRTQHRHRTATIPEADTEPSQPRRKPLLRDLEAAH